MLIMFITLAVVFRGATLLISISNERKLKAEGGTEIGKTNSSILAGAHLVFYLCAIVEYAFSDYTIDAVTWLGLAIYLVGATFLIVVIANLGRQWTVKLIIARNHVLVTSLLFRLVRHPNYYLNIIPELIGFALTLHAFWTVAVGIPLYLIPLFVRISQEEKAMRVHFPQY
jgi:isoprenylcysteine carboxyl methyltransferase (ICMT) family protein YpbQ